VEEVIGYLQHDFFGIVGQPYNMTSFVQQSMEISGWDTYSNKNDDNDDDQKA
jgi:hypothetical protein